MTSYIQWPGSNFEYSGFNYIVLNCNPFVSQKSFPSLGTNLFVKNGVEILEMTTPKHSDPKKPKTLYSHETIPLHLIRLNMFFFIMASNAFVCHPNQCLIRLRDWLLKIATLLLFYSIFLSPVFRLVVHIACKNNTINNLFFSRTDSAEYAILYASIEANCLWRMLRIE